MSNDTEMSRLAVLAAIIVAVSAAIAFIPASDAEDTGVPEVDKDLGEIWSYGYQFEFLGGNANAIRWNFGDGSPELYDDYEDGVIDNDIWNPAHHYEKTGTYYITLTTYNDYDPDEDGVGSSTTSVYSLTVRGYPTVTLVYNNGQENGIIQQNAGESNAVPAVKPADPVKDGYDFTGWYTDEGCTQAYDWSAPVVEPITLYAGWASQTGDDDDGGIDVIAIAAIVVGIIIAVIALIYFLPAAIVGVIIVVIGALKFAGVF